MEFSSETQASGGVIFYFTAPPRWSGITLNYHKLHGSVVNKREQHYEETRRLSPFASGISLYALQPFSLCWPSLRPFSPFALRPSPFAFRLSPLVSPRSYLFNMPLLATSRR
ncbi:hypothetical protein GY45DRAFT_1376495 [Cubamyces sp. BRFM 1775]|nr:hypothetical protein GY45DRAFT_1376495 [Cubamyces sp. BRFM 1775]